MIFASPAVPDELTVRLPADTDWVPTAVILAVPVGFEFCTVIGLPKRVSIWAPEATMPIWPGASWLSIRIELPLRLCVPLPVWKMPA